MAKLRATRAGRLFGIVMIVGALALVLGGLGPTPVAAQSDSSVDNVNANNFILDCIAQGGDPVPNIIDGVTYVTCNYSFGTKMCSFWGGGRTYCDWIEARVPDAPPVTPDERGVDLTEETGVDPRTAPAPIGTVDEPVEVRR